MQVAAEPEQQVLQPAAVVLVAAVLAERPPLMEALEPLTEVAAVVAEVIRLATAAPAAPASSSFPTLWRPELQSSLSPQQRGLHRLAQRRWITLSWAVVQEAADMAVEAVQADLELAPRFL